MKNPHEVCPQLREDLYGDPLSPNYHGYTESDLRRKAEDKQERDRYASAIDKLKKEGKHRTVTSEEWDDLIDRTIEEMRRENH